MKGNKGITLITLIITIIVLLILASISIAMLSGENGLLSKDSESSVEIRISNAKEAAVLDLADVIDEYYNQKYVESNTTNTESLLTFVANNWVSSDTSLYTLTLTTTGETAVTVVIVPTAADGTSVSGTVQEDGKIVWSD